MLHPLSISATNSLHKDVSRSFERNVNVSPALCRQYQYLQELLLLSKYCLFCADDIPFVNLHCGPREFLSSVWDGGGSLTGGFKQLLWSEWFLFCILQEEKKFTKTVQGKVQSSYHHSVQEIGELLKKRLDTIKKLKIWEMHPWQTPQGSDTRVPDRSNIQYTITLIQNFLIVHEGLKIIKQFF